MKRVSITVGSNETTALKQGECILDHYAGKPEFAPDAVMTFNQHSGIMHVESEAESGKRKQNIKGS